MPVSHNVNKLWRYFPVVEFVARSGFFRSTRAKTGLSVVTIFGVEVSPLSKNLMISRHNVPRIQSGLISELLSLLLGTGMTWYQETPRGSKRLG